MGKSTRTTISIPADLKARMEAVGEPVNWSAVASRAFELKLAEIDSRREVKDMKDVIQRLRGSKQKAIESAHSLGLEDGRAWAREKAEYEHLDRLSSARLADREWDISFSAGADSAWSAAERFVFVISPTDDGDRDAARDFWAEWLGDRHEEIVEQDGYVQSFAEGALEVWGEVKDQL